MVEPQLLVETALVEAVPDVANVPSPDDGTTTDGMLHDGDCCCWLCTAVLLCF